MTSLRLCPFLNRQICSNAAAGNPQPGATQSRTRLFDHAEQRQIGSECFALVDAFHPFLPASVEEYISQPHELTKETPTHGRLGHHWKCLDGCTCHSAREQDARHQVNNASTDGFSALVDSASEAHRYHGEHHEDNLLLDTIGPKLKLPSEVSDLIIIILSYLSLASLDAARHNCSNWRTKIMSNSWVLSIVLGVKEKRSPLDGSLSGKLSHRDLLEKFGCDSDLPSTCQHPESQTPGVRGSEHEIWILDTNSFFDTDEARFACCCEDRYSEGVSSFPATITSPKYRESLEKYLGHLSP